MIGCLLGIAVAVLAAMRMAAEEGERTKWEDEESQMK